MNGALLMTYGSPASLERDDIEAYMTRVRHGRQPADDLVAEFERRYRRIGGSPLIAITRRQAATLEGALGWPVEVGMRFSEPSIERGLGTLGRRGVTRVATIVLSPQFSPLLMGGYARAVEDAGAALGPGAPTTAIAGAWHREPSFVAAVARRIREALARLPGADADATPVLLTAHSLPLRVAQQEPGYLGQLDETATAIAEEAGLSRHRWHFCWQSAGHEPGEWMKPDFAELLPRFSAQGHRAVVVAPVQFLADHLEILYDIDVAAREQADAAGIRLERVASLNDDPDLIGALAAVARTTLARLGPPAMPVGARPAPPPAARSSPGRTAP